MITRIAAIAALIGLGGCATAYVAPKEGPTASMRIVASTVWDGNAHVRNVPGPGICGWDITPTYVNITSIGILHGMALNHNRQKLSLPGSSEINEKDYTEIKIPAGKPFAFVIAGQNMGHLGISPDTGKMALVGGRGCVFTEEFTPESGKIYEAIYATVPAENPTDCTISVSELVTQTDGSVARRLEKTAHAREIQCRGVLRIDQLGKQP